MKILKIKLLSLLSIDISLNNIGLKHLILDEFKKLSVVDRESLLEHYKVSTVYQLIGRFKFMSESDLRKKYDSYRFNPNDVENENELFAEGLSFYQYKKELGKIGIKKGELFLNDFDHYQMSLIINKFICKNPDIIKDVELLINSKEFIKQKGESVYNSLIDSEKLVLTELK